MGQLLTLYLWVLLLASLAASGTLAARVSHSELKVRLAAYLSFYNVACVLLRFVMPSREAAQALNWMDPMLLLTAAVVNPIDAAVHLEDPALRIAVRATATLLGSTAAWFGLGWLLGGMLDERLKE